MSEKAVEEIRQAILEHLYAAWMENTRSSWEFGDKTPEDWEPEAAVAIRECKQMQWYGWVEIASESDALDRASVRLTPCGRDTWESFLKEKEKNPAAVLSPTVA